MAKRKQEETGPSPSRKRANIQPSETATTLSDSETATLSKLRTLLDLSGLTSAEDISTRFDGIAKVLLGEVILRLTDAQLSVTDFEVYELEFYLHKTGCHEDPFTHGTEEQRKSGNWYFHRAPRRNKEGESSEVRAPSAAGGYRGGTRKGMDLTFGGPVNLPVSDTQTPVTSKFFPQPPSDYSAPPPASESTASNGAQEKVRGGILLRTICRVADGKLFSGPSLLVDEILRVSGAPNLSALVTDVWDSNITAFPSGITPHGTPSLRLHPKHSTTLSQPPTQIYSSPRVGLELSHASIPLPSSDGTQATLAHPRTTYVSRAYRYFVSPTLLTSNGRGHTFLAVYQDLAGKTPSNKRDVDLAAQLAAITGLKLATATKYLEEYRASQASGSLRAFVGAQGKGAGSSPVSFLRLMGALERCRKAQERE